MKEALYLTRELLKMVPYHQQALDNIKHYEKLLLQQGVSDEKYYLSLVLAQHLFLK